MLELVEKDGDLLVLLKEKDDYRLICTFYDKDNIDFDLLNRTFCLLEKYGVVDECKEARSLSEHCQNLY